ncbi:MAG: hypothetical protein ACRDJ9_22100 [Dehalococcoidia bacterium]
MIELLEGLVERTVGFMEGAIVLVAIVMAVVVWVTSRAILPALGALVFGAFMIWAVQNIDFIQERIGEELDPEGETTDSAPADATPPAQLDSALDNVIISVRVPASG